MFFTPVHEAEVQDGRREFEPFHPHVFGTYVERQAETRQAADIRNERLCIQPVHVDVSFRIGRYIQSVQAQGEVPARIHGPLLPVQGNVEPVVVHVGPGEPSLEVHPSADRKLVIDTTRVSRRNVHHRIGTGHQATHVVGIGLGAELDELHETFGKIKSPCHIESCLDGPEIAARIETGTEKRHVQVETDLVHRLQIRFYVMPRHPVVQQRHQLPVVPYRIEYRFERKCIGIKIYGCRTQHGDVNVPSVGTQGGIEVTAHRGTLHEIGGPVLLGRSPGSRQQHQDGYKT